MDWAETLLDLALGGVALSLDTDLAHVKKSAVARLGEHNPLRGISANHDLVRALRLSWVRAALDVLDRALARASEPEWRPRRSEIERFDRLARAELRAVRATAFDRNVHPGETAIDAALKTVLAGVSDFVGSSADDGERDAIGRAFGPTLAAIVGWPPAELPALVLRVAEEGVELPGHHGAPGVRRRFGELVFAEFADLIKDPDKYPEAGAAFKLAMHHALRGLAEDTVALLRGLDERIDRALPQIDALQALQAGLAQQSEKFAALRTGLAAVPEATVDALMQRLQAEGALSGLERRTLIALAQRLTQDEVRDVDRAVKELEHAVALAAQVMSQGPASSPDNAFVAGVLSDVAEHTRAGSLDLGSEAVDAALAELDRQEAKLRETQQDSSRVLIEAGVQQDLLRRDAPAVARRLEMLAALEDPLRPLAAPSYLARAKAFYDEGRVKGVNLSLQVAIEMTRRLREAAEGARARREASALLAAALLTLGERETDPLHLEQAVALRREILAGIARADDGPAWAAAQGALGEALNQLGWRVYDPAMLTESIAAQRAELEEVTRGRDAPGWAAAQCRLGRALYTLGFREGDAALLRQAEQAFDQALKVYTRSATPEEWARAHNLRGISLSMLGRLDGLVSTSRRAVQAYEETLKETQRDRSPVRWAGCMSNLALELMALGRKTGDSAVLDTAIGAFRDVLAARSSEQHGVDWATTQHNLGGALMTRAEAGGDASLLEDAAHALRAALGVFDREATPVYWTASQTDLSTTLTSLGRHRRSAELLHEGVAAARAALSLRDRATAPLEWANSQLALAHAWRALAELGADADSARAAAEAYRLALGEIRPERRPEEYAEAEAGLEALRALL